MDSSHHGRLLCLTVDYEVFGNGSGDVRRHVTDPTERMARVCERAGVPLTVFVEVEEVMAFERHDRQLSRDLGYSPAALIREQVASLAARGHDIQLHLHPEWVGASYENGRWALRRECRTVDSLFATEGETIRYAGERKAFLESISGRRVVAYRAGAFTAQPGVKLLRALAAHGIVIDSSVVKGLVRGGHCGALDYRNAPVSKPCWRVLSDVAVENTAGDVWEVPIYSVMGRRLQQLTWRRLRAKFSRNVPRDRQYEMIEQLGGGRGMTAGLKLLWEPVPIKLDFHNLSAHELLRMVKAAPCPNDGSPDVLILIGHTKEHVDDKPLARFLDRVSADPGLAIVGLTDLADRLKSKPPAQQVNGHAVPRSVNV